MWKQKATNEMMKKIQIDNNLRLRVMKTYKETIK